MEGRSLKAIMDHFAVLRDPRIETKTTHRLGEIIVMAVLAALCGADGWVAVQTFAETRKEWLKRFLQLPGGIPSHDTFGRVFAALDPDEFAACFRDWMQSVFEISEGEVIPIDGKTLRRSFDRKNQKAALHMVSAWAAENGVSLGQVATQEKSNEITAIPRLLQVLEISGAVVTIDAMGCQKEIARTIRQKKADYVLALKDNQQHLREIVAEYFASQEQHENDGIVFDYHETYQRGHGRTERRMYLTAPAPGHLDPHGEWTDLTSIGLALCERECEGRTSIEQRFYINSLPNDAQRFARAVRQHWAIENSLHWSLDVTFREDDSRMRCGHSVRNFAAIRRLALTLLKQETTAQVGLKNKRLRAALDPNYLLRVLNPTNRT